MQQASLNWIYSTMNGNLEIFLICIKSSSKELYSVTFRVFLLTLTTTLQGLKVKLLQFTPLFSNLLTVNKSAKVMCKISVWYNAQSEAIVMFRGYSVFVFLPLTTTLQGSKVKLLQLAPLSPNFLTVSKSAKVMCKISVWYNAQSEAIVMLRGYSVFVFITVDNNITRLESKTVTTRPTLPHWKVFACGPLALMAITVTIFVTDVLCT